MDSYLWKSTELPKFIKQSVLAPLKTQKELFTNDDVLPVQRCNMVFGRDGVGKCTALKSILKGNDISYLVMDAEESTTQIGENDAQVLIIENANSLIIGPYATEESRKFALELRKMSYSLKIFIFCLVNIVPQNMTQGDRDLLACQFLQNFDATIYFEAPSVEYREKIFKKLFANFFDHVGDDWKDELDQESYNLMVDSSRYCTPLQLQRFAQRVALVVVQQPKGTPVNTEFIKECLFNMGPGNWSITKEISGNTEDKFAASAGLSIPSGRAQVEYESAKQMKITDFVLEDDDEKRSREEEEEDLPPKKIKI